MADQIIHQIKQKTLQKPLLKSQTKMDKKNKETRFARMILVKTSLETNNLRNIRNKGPRDPGVRTFKNPDCNRRRRAIRLYQGTHWSGSLRIKIAIGASSKR